MYNYKSDFEFSAEEMLKKYTDFIRERENKNMYSAVSNDEDDYIRVYSSMTGDDDRWLPAPNSKKETIKVSKEACKEIKIEEGDMDYIKAVQSHIASKIQPIIEKVVDTHDYDDGPIYKDEVSPIVLKQMAEKAYEEAMSEIPQLDYKSVDLHWSKTALAEELVKQLMLIEIFGRRRPLYRSMRDYDYRYY